MENAPSRIGFFFLLAFVCISVSRIFDFWLNNLHIPLVFALLAAAFTFVGGAIPVAFQSRAGKLMLMFGIWLVVCIPFSHWRSSSLTVLTDTFSKSFLVFLMVAGSMTTVIRARRMMMAVAGSAFVAMMIANIFQARIRGRLTMPSGFLANPNDLAQTMLMGMCFMPIFAVGKGPAARFGVGFAMFPLLYTVFDTGSRAALIVLMVLAAVVFWRAGAGRKVTLLLVFVALGVGLFSVSHTARTRLETLLGRGSGPPTDSDDVARASTTVRTQALSQSLELTIKNPIFGVGPGSFATVAADLSHEDGHRAAWVETHNSYTQVSSEMGIPGILFFSGAIIACLAGLNRVSKMAAPHLRNSSLAGTAYCMLAGLGGFALIAAFVSVAYQFQFSLLIGMSAATVGVLERELRSRKARTVSPVPPQPMSVLPNAANRIRG